MGKEAVRLTVDSDRAQGGMLPMRVGYDQLVGAAVGGRHVVYAEPHRAVGQRRLLDARVRRGQRRAVLVPAREERPSCTRAAGLLTKLVTNGQLARVEELI